ncbi:MAG: hypothetical protein JOZ62_02795 [Acidobacteriaceae bacterium]|nr:hypothetical protein [Acidobacteriaceae bacterium]
MRLSFHLSRAEQSEIAIEMLPKRLSYVVSAAILLAGALDIATPARSTPAARNYYVAPYGCPTGDGSMKRPWDLRSTLEGKQRVMAGDRIWLRGGTYGDGRTKFTSTVHGTADKPIIVRGMHGERATINGGLDIYGAYTWYWDFEVTNLIGDRSETGNAPEGIDTYEGSEGTKFIDLVVHDTSQGFGFWQPAINGEIYGCLIYYNGYQGPDRGHGHGIYTQNLIGTKEILDNIIFAQFGLGIQAYGSGKAHVSGYRVAGNVLFNNGILSIGGHRVDNILFAGGDRLSRIAVNNNFTYASPGENSGYSRLGWVFGTSENEDVSATNNYWMGGESGLEVWKWRSVTFTGNSVYSPAGLVMLLDAADPRALKQYRWDANHYYGSGSFRLSDGGNRDFNSWKRNTGLDTNSTFASGRPQGVQMFVRRNKYEAGRANVVVYNWDRKETVPVDLRGILASGQRFEIRDAQNFYGRPVVSGIYTEKPVELPMTNDAVALPIGRVPTRPVHTSPEFAVFVVLPQ